MPATSRPKTHSQRHLMWRTFARLAFELVYGQVGLLERAVGGDFTRRTGGDDAPAFDDIGAIGEREGESGPLVDEQERRRLGAQPVECREHVVDHRGGATER